MVIDTSKVRILTTPPGYEHLDWIFVSHEDLIKAGLRYLEPFSIVEIRGEFFELNAYLDYPEVWWISPVEEKEVPDTFPEEWVEEARRRRGESGDSPNTNSS